MPLRHRRRSRSRRTRVRGSRLPRAARLVVASLARQRAKMRCRPGSTPHHQTIRHISRALHVAVRIATPSGVDTEHCVDDRATWCTRGRSDWPRQRGTVGDVYVDRGHRPMPPASPLPDGSNSGPRHSLDGSVINALTGVAFLCRAGADADEMAPAVGPERHGRHGLPLMCLPVCMEATSASSQAKRRSSSTANRYPRLEWSRTVGDRWIYVAMTEEASARFVNR